MAHKTRDLDELERQIIRVQQSVGTRMPGFIRIHNWLRMHSKLYYKWHTTPAANVAHVSLLTFFLIIAGLFSLAVILIAVGWAFYANFDAFQALFSQLYQWWQSMVA